MAEDNIKLYDIWRESSQKFDYFITGLIGALVAFVGQSFHPERIGFNPGTIELISLLVLIVSLLAGFKRIESSVESFRLMHQKNRAEDQLLRIRKIENAGQLAQNIKSGELLTQQELSQKEKTYQTQFDAADKHLNIYMKRATRYYKVRNNLLILGFFLLVLARLSKVYFCAP